MCLIGPDQNGGRSVQAQVQDLLVARDGGWNRHCFFFRGPSSKFSCNAAMLRRGQSRTGRPSVMRSGPGPSEQFLNMHLFGRPFGQDVLLRGNRSTDVACSCPRSLDLDELGQLGGVIPRLWEPIGPKNAPTPSLANGRPRTRGLRFEDEWVGFIYSQSEEKKNKVFSPRQMAFD